MRLIHGGWLLRTLGTRPPPATNSHPIGFDLIDCTFYTDTTTAPKLPTVTMGSAATSSWTEIVSKKRSLREQALAPYLVDDLDQRPPRVQDVSTRSRIDEDVQRITDIDNIGALLDRLTTGEFTAESVVQAYIRR